MRYTAEKARTNFKVISSYGPLHMDQQGLTNNSPDRIQDIAWKRAMDDRDQ